VLFVSPRAVLSPPSKSRFFKKRRIALRRLGSNGRKPAAEGGIQYVIRSPYEDHQRVAKENELDRY
jgi:hypothetical protein